MTLCTGISFAGCSNISVTNKIFHFFNDNQRILVDDNVNVRIEIQIFSLHWMMQNISVLMSPRSPSGFTDIKKPNVLHHPVQAKNLHFNS